MSAEKKKELQVAALENGTAIDHILVLLEKLVGDLDHTLASHLVAMEIIADRDRIVHFLQSQ